MLQLHRVSGKQIQILALFVCCFWSGKMLQAQMMQVTSANTPPFTPENLISNVFLGDGVEVTNITYNGQNVAVGYFTNGMQAVGLERGIVMSSGLVETDNPAFNEFGSHENGSVFANNILNGFIPGSDPDLGALATSDLYDITRYTITFVPTSDTLRFRYVFASEEYPEFACSAYNDIFGFFIQGPNYPSPTNIAIIPGTALPVSINNIHPDNSSPNSPCPPKNAQFFNDNNGSNKQPTYDGFTRTFTAEAIVVPCQTYTIKLVIADVGDPNYDSGVFLEAKSFGTGALRTELATPSLDGTITEGCAAGSLTFRLPAPATEDFPIDYTIIGNAVNGIDYQTIPAGLFIPAGEQEIVIPIIAFEDGLVENGEFLAIDVKRDPCNRDTIQIMLRDNSMIAPDQLLDTTYCLGASAVALNGTLPIPLPTPPSFTNNQDFSINPVNTTIASSINVFGVLPPILQPGMIRSVCLNATHNWVDDLDFYLVSPGGQFLELMTDCGADGINYTNTCFTPTATNAINQTTKFDAPYTGDWLPEGPWSDLWGGGAFPVNGTWQLQVKDDNNGIVGTLNDWTITFEPLYEITYQWSPAAGLSCTDCPVPNASPNTSTNYTMLAVDSYGCMLTDSVKVDVAETLEAPVVSCGGFTNNSITFNWSAVPNAVGYQVNVNGAGWISPTGATSHLVSSLAPSSIVTIEVQALSSSAVPCPALIGTVTCSNCDQPVVAAIANPESCNGAADGSITITTDGLNPPYTFELGATQNSTGIFNNLAPGNFTVTVTDNTGCQALATSNIAAPPILSVEISPTNVICFGGDNGAANAMGMGGTGMLSYQWNDPASQSLANAVNLSTGTYTVTVTDLNGCTATASTSLSEPPNMNLFVAAGPTKCFGDSTGLATVTANGGIAPYQFAWSTGQIGPIATNLPAGNYIVTVTDAVGCAKTSFALIGQPPALTADISSMPASCADLENGSASAINVQGGTGTFNYQWNDPSGQTTAVAANLGAGTYTVTITDQNGCSVVQDTTVVAPPAITVNLSNLNVRCFGENNGSATAMAVGGSGMLTYLWNDPLAQNSTTANNLVANTYTVTVTDQNGCTVQSSVLITEPEAIILDLTATSATCFGTADGSVLAQVQGGTTPLGYLWNSSETTPNISNKPAGTYTVTATDAAGCTASSSTIVVEPEALAVSFAAQNIDCFGGNTGAIQLEISGGTGAYTVDWSGPNGFTASGTDLSNIGSGNYTAIISDSAGCTAQQSILLEQPTAPLEIDLPFLGDTVCYGASNGSATALASGGTLPYSYLWSANNQTTATATGLSTNLYMVTITDAKNCTAVDTVFIPQKEELFVWAEGGTVDCFGANDGTASVTIVFYGAMQANLNQFSYKWNTVPVQTGLQASGLQAGKTYTVTVTDQRGCSGTQTATIGDVSPIGAAVSASMDPLCHNGKDGWIIASGFGGTAPYSYSWPPLVTDISDSLAFNLSAGKYLVTVTDSKGCSGTVSAQLSQPDPLKINFNTTAALCFGDSTGSLSATPSGGTPAYAFTWSTGDQTKAIQNLPAGNYQVTMTDQNGCTISDTAEVEQPESPLGGTTVKVDIGCFGGNAGEIKISAMGGTAPYRYALNAGNWNGSSTQIGLQTGVYVPRILDKNGCEVELPPVEILERAPVQVDLGPTLTINYGERTGLLAIVWAAQEPVQYFWNAADSIWLSCLDCPNPFVDNLEFGHWFELTVVDALGCTGQSRVLVTVEKPRRVFVPTGFSPNGDGTNDLLLAHGQSETRVLAFQVFDRWGELVYEGRDFQLNDSNSGWDGSFRGQPVNPGVYAWILNVEYQDGVQETYRGSTTLIR